ncbi:ORF3 [Maize-associated tombusvirus]|nr:ORF3 [Maize-associated tombusvirus]UKP15132.1 ORF3 [Maize-associated tombusvirus]
MARKNQQQNAAKAINQKKTKAKTKSAVVRAPTSISVRNTTQNSGSRQEVMIGTVTNEAKVLTLHCANMPWLQGVAPSYQTWNMKDVRVKFVPRMSTATNGTVSMCFLRDFEDATPTTVDQMSLVQGTVSAAVWDKLNLRVPDRKAMAYCSRSNFLLMGSTDKSERALGRIVVVPDTDLDIKAKIGYLYVEYTPQFTGPIDPLLQKEG